MNIKNVLIFGYGYVTKFLLSNLVSQGYVVYISSRKITRECTLLNNKVHIINFNSSKIKDLIKNCQIIISTVPPNNNHDDVLHQYSESLLAAKNLLWLGYLSATNVYGNHNGNWVNEKSLCNPTNIKSKLRFDIETQWHDFYQKNLPIHIFRIAGIYGPNRNILQNIQNDRDYTFCKKNHYFSRIHVIDICRILITSILQPTPGEIYNLSDSKPASLSEVYQYGATLMNKPKLREIDWKDGKLSMQSRYFFQDNKRVSNDKVLYNLNIKLTYDNYQTGLLFGCLPFIKW